MKTAYELLAVGAHPDDVEVFMGATLAKLAERGVSVLLVDLCDGEPARHAESGARRDQAMEAARILGADRVILDFQDRLLQDTIEARLAVADLIRRLRPRWISTSEGCGVHPDHAAVTDIVTGAVFYARLPKWDQVPGGEILADSPPHEIDSPCPHIDPSD